MRIFLFMILFFSTSCIADLSGFAPLPYFDVSQPMSQNQAVTTTSKALQKYPEVSILIKNSENWFYSEARGIGLEKEYLIPTVAIAAPLMSHRVSTQQFNTDISSYQSLTMRPDIDYYFDTGETKIAFTLTWRF